MSQNKIIRSASASCPPQRQSFGDNDSHKNENHYKVTIIGAGAWGLALANVITGNNHEVTIFAKEKSDENFISKKHISPRLPKIKISNQINVTHDFKKSLTSSKFIFIVTPSTATLEVIKKIAQNKISKDVILVICSKGIENKTSKLFSQIVSENLPNNNFAILSGPNFAVEVAAKLPTITSIASSKKLVADKIITVLKNNYFLPIYSNDIITTQIAGAIKNILAIGCGIIEGLKLGENAKAALITKGVNEIVLLSKKLGGKSASLFSSAGFGDLFLTCSSTKSRNFSLGILIGIGKNPTEILSDKNKVFEGSKSVKSIVALAKKHKIKLPICLMINDILYKKADCLKLKSIIILS